MRVVFMGTPDIAATCLKKIIADGFEVVAVYTQPDRPKGRGMKLVQSPVKELALQQGLPVFQPESFRDDDAVEQLRALRPDVAAVVAQCLDSDLEVGRLGFFPGKFIPSLDRMRFEVKGENSVVAAADLILRLDSLRSDVCAVATCSVRTCGDEDCSPERTIVDGTMRVLNEGLRSRLKEMIAHAAEEIDYKYDVEIDTEIEDCVPCVDNNTHLSYEATLLADSLGFDVEDLEE